MAVVALGELWATAEGRVMACIHDVTPQVFVTH
jgi:hypothetical protein